MRRLVGVLCVSFLFPLLTLQAQQGDISGSKDSPLLKRYEGSRIVLYSSSDYDSYTLPVGPSTGAYNNASLTRTESLEGRVTRLTYLVPQGRSPLEIIRNYQRELEGAGYRVLFQASGATLRGKTDRSAFASASGLSRLKIGSQGTLNYLARDSEKDDIYLAARLDRPEGNVHVALYAVEISPGAVRNLSLAGIANPGEVILQVDLVEGKAMESRMVTVSAAEMSQAIASTGSVPLYGIYFDSNSAGLKPESRPTLEEIARLLKEQPKLRLLVVGHTDNVGSYEANLDLSTRRAHAVVQALTKEHGADGKRLVPLGLSFASPTATNRSEEGRAKNRRVQLVEF